MADVALRTDWAVQPTFWTRLRSQTRNLGTFCRRYPLGAFGGAVMVILLILAAVPGVFATQHYEEFSVVARLEGASSEHWLGTDALGRDTYSRIIYGAQTSIIIGFGSVFVVAIAATLLGVLSAYLGSWFDLLFQRFIDIWQAFPGLIFVIFVVSIFGSSRLLIVLTMALIFSAGSSRVIRGASLTILNRPFIEAARSVGATGPRIVMRHIIPNIVPIVIINASIQIGAVILIESSLSFLGFGIPPPFPSWGRMLQDAQRIMFHQPLIALAPGAAIAIAVYAFNVLGDALRDALDPRLRGSGPGG